MINFKCSFPQSKCDEIEKDLSKFAPSVMPFQHGDFWDQPSAFRQLEGLIQMVNNYAQITAPFSWMDMDLKTKNLNIFYNCNKGNVAKFLKQPIEKD